MVCLYVSCVHVCVHACLCDKCYVWRTNGKGLTEAVPLILGKLLEEQAAGILLQVSEGWQGFRGG